MGLPRRTDLCHYSKNSKQNMTATERHLWFHFLREYPIGFSQQRVIGPYIVDFFCNKVRLSIELDGYHHTHEPQLSYDRQRKRYLEMLEVKELRFLDNVVWENFDGVCETIHEAVESRRNDCREVSLLEVKNKR